jgi:hypothetical protein
MGRKWNRRRRRRCYDCMGTWTWMVYTDVSRLRTEAGGVIGRGYEEGEPLQRPDAGKAHDLLLWKQTAFHVAERIATFVGYCAHLLIGHRQAESFWVCLRSGR